MPSSLNGTGVTFNDTTTQATAYIGHRAQVFTSSGTFTAPTGVYNVKVTVVGGGGGGGQGSTELAGYTTISYPGGSGGGGGVAAGHISVTPGQTYVVTVGSAGNGSNSGNGSAGGTSSFGSLLTGAGGGGGQGRTTGSSAGGASGANGVGSGAAFNAMLDPESIGSVTNKRPNATSSTAGLAYVIGNASTHSVGMGGSGETSVAANNATGGIGGAVLVEW